MLEINLHILPYIFLCIILLYSSTFDQIFAQQYCNNQTNFGNILLSTQISGANSSQSMDINTNYDLKEKTWITLGSHEASHNNSADSLGVQTQPLLNNNFSAKPQL